MTAEASERRTLSGCRYADQNPLGSAPGLSQRKSGLMSALRLPQTHKNCANPLFLRQKHFPKLQQWGSVRLVSGSTPTVTRRFFGARGLLYGRTGKIGCASNGGSSQHATRPATSGRSERDRQIAFPHGRAASFYQFESSAGQDRTIC